jgi:hypothetical protein
MGEECLRALAVVVATMTNSACEHRQRQAMTNGRVTIDRVTHTAALCVSALAVVVATMTNSTWAHRTATGRNQGGGVRIVGPHTLPHSAL